MIIIKYVFLSYSSQNTAEAEALREMFENNGIKTWMANRDIAGGENFASAIIPAIEGCSCFVLLLTQEAQDSSWVDKEVERAVHYNKPIVPVELTQVELNKKFEFYISTSQIVMLSCIQEDDVANQRLVNTVKNHMNGNNVRVSKLSFSLPHRGSGVKAWVQLAIPAVFILLVIFMMINIISQNPSFTNKDNTLSSVTNSDNSLSFFSNTIEPPSKDKVNQIPEKYADSVAAEANAEKDSQNSNVINVGELWTPSLVSDYYFYSQDSRIAVGDGQSIKGVSAGITYIVAVDKEFENMTKTYCVAVNDPEAAPKGKNQVPKDLSHHIEIFENSEDSYKSRKTIWLKVGKERTVVTNTLHDKYILRSADTGIAESTGVGSMIRAVSPGVTYILVENTFGGVSYDTYRVVVQE